MTNPHENSSEQSSSQKKPEFIKGYEEPLPTGFSNRQWAVLFCAGFLILAGLGYRFFSRGDIKLISPLSKAAIAAEELEFNWQCNKQGVSFVIEVYDSQGNIVMRQITDQQSYQPALTQKAPLQANAVYQWYVIPNPDVEQKYTLNKSETYTFQITKAVELPATPEPQKPQVTPPALPAEPQPNQPPNRRPQDFREIIE